MFIDGLDKICMKCRGSTIVLNYNPPVLFFRSAFQEMSDQNAIISQGRARSWEGRWEGREGWREAGREADDREGEGEGEPICSILGILLTPLHLGIKC